MHLCLSLPLAMACGRIGFDRLAASDDGGVDASATGVDAAQADAAQVDAATGGAVMAAADHVIFEAEIGVGEWTVVSVANPMATRSGTILLGDSSNASGGAAIWANENATAIPFMTPITWRIRFQNPGTYRLFARFSLVDTEMVFQNYLAEDSAFMSPAFDAPIDGSRQLSPPDVGLTPGMPGTEANYIWFDDNEDFTVTPAHVAAPFVEFSLARREEGISVDRIAFVDVNSSIVLGDLDSLPNSPSVP
jgi:hypothetical protein